MQFRIAHRFPCTPDRFWALIREPGYEADLQKESSMDITVLQREDRGGHLLERFKLVSRTPLPALVQRAAGVDRISYEQELDSDHATKVITWKVKTLFLTDKVKCGGTSKVIPAPGGGCERVLEGEITVAVPLVGGQIEKQIVEQLQSSYDKAARVIERRLKA